MSETIGFVGLGHLSLPIATNLLNAGYALYVYNRTASKAESLVAQGAQLARQPADTVTPGGIVASLVWDDVALESIVMSEGFLEKLGSGGIHVAMSTVLPETSRKLAALHAQHGSIYVEASIFGRPEEPLPGISGFLSRVHGRLKNAFVRFLRRWEDVASSISAKRSARQIPSKSSETS